MKVTDWIRKNTRSFDRTKYIPFLRQPINAETILFGVFLARPDEAVLPSALCCDPRLCLCGAPPFFFCCIGPNRGFVKDVEAYDIIPGIVFL